MNNLVKKLKRKRKFRKYDEIKYTINNKRRKCKNNNNKRTSNKFNENNNNMNIITTKKRNNHNINVKSNNYNSDELQFLDAINKYDNYPNELKKYFIHHDMFLNLDQIIVEILCIIFPKHISININQYIDTYFTDHDIKMGVTFANDLANDNYLFWNEIYYQLNKRFLPIHDLDWYYWYDRNCMLTPMPDENRLYCVACYDMFWNIHGIDEYQHHIKHKGLKEKAYFYSYNDNAIEHKLNMYNNTDLLPKCCPGTRCKGRCIQDNASCIMLDLRIMEEKRLSQIGDRTRKKLTFLKQNK